MAKENNFSLPHWAAGQAQHGECVRRSTWGGEPASPLVARQGLTSRTGGQTVREGGLCERLVCAIAF